MDRLKDDPTARGARFRSRRAIDANATLEKKGAIGCNSYLGVGGLAVEVLELLDDVLDVLNALLVDEEVEEVGGEGVEVSLLAELRDDVLLGLVLHGGVGEEGTDGRVGSHVGSDGLHVAVDGLERAFLSEHASMRAEA